MTTRARALALAAAALLFALALAAWWSLEDAGQAPQPSSARRPARAAHEATDGTRLRDAQPAGTGEAMGDETARRAVPPASARVSASLVLRGCVLDGDEPARDFVVLAGSSDGGEEVEASTDALGSVDGRFELELPRAGHWRVLARGPHGLDSAPPVVVRVPRAEEVQLRIAAGVAVDGSVVDAWGAALPGAAIELAHPRGESRHEAGADGSFELRGLPPGEISLRATAVDHVASAPVEIQATAGERLEGVVLRLGRGGRVSGVVLDDAGRPQAGADVAALALDDAEADARTCNSDAAGAFEFRALAPGPTLILARAPGMGLPRGGEDAPPRQLVLEVVAGGEHHVVLGGPDEPEVLVRGRITRAGRPLAGAELIAVPEGPVLLVQAVEVVLDEQGRFQVRLRRAGALALVVRAGRRLRSFHLDVPAEGLDGVELELSWGRIEGRVVGEAGAPWSGVDVLLEREDASGILGLGPDPMHVDSDAEGRFAFEGLDPGSWSLRAFGRGLGSPLLGGVQLGDDETVSGLVLRLEPGGQITGRVVDAHGRAVHDASILLRDERGRWVLPRSTVESESDGSFLAPRFAGLPPGRYGVQARCAQGVSPEIEHVVVRAGEPTRVELRLGPGSTLCVRLLDSRGRPQPLASLRVLDETGRLQSGLVLTHELERVLREGLSMQEQRVGPLLPGTYRVEARAVDGRSASAEVVLAGEPLLTLELPVE